MSYENYKDWRKIEFGSYRQLLHWALRCMRIFSPDHQKSVLSGATSIDKDFCVRQMCFMLCLRKDSFYGAGSSVHGLSDVPLVPDNYVSIPEYLNSQKGLKAGDLIDFLMSDIVGIERFYTADANYVSYFFDRNELKRVYDERSRIAVKEKTVEKIMSAKKKKEEADDEECEAYYQDQIGDILSSNGYFIDIEHPIPSGQSIDIYSKKGDDEIVIECKITTSPSEVTRAIGQLICYKYYYPKSRMVAAFKIVPRDEFVKIMESNNIEVIVKPEEII